MAEPIPHYAFSLHALRQLRRRGVTLEIVHQTMLGPEQRFPVTLRRDVLQSRATISGTRYLVRVFVDVGVDPPEVVTVYRTSKVSKYWRTDE